MKLATWNVNDATVTRVTRRALWKRSVSPALVLQVLLLGCGGLVSLGRCQPILAQPPQERGSGDELKVPVQRRESPQDKLTEPTESLAGGKIPLPATLPRSTADGRLILPIGFFHSQAAQLVPRHYYPVGLDRLSQAIADSKAQANSDRTSRIRSSFYDIRLEGDTLISDQSILELQTEQTTVIRRPLGPVNLAIARARGLTESSVTDANAGPRLETDESGMLSAVFDGGISGGNASIRFRWSLRGKTTNTGREFTLRLPQSPQTRIVLSVPADIVVESFDGVIRRSPGPPPDAAITSRGSDVHWYVLDAGGLSTVRLQTRRATAVDDRDVVIVRQSGVLYEVDSTGVGWTHQMRIQVPRSRKLPPLRYARGVVTSVRIDSIETPFTRRELVSGIREMTIPTTLGSIRDDTSFALTIEGRSSWDASGWLDLPLLRFQDADVITTQVVDTAEVVVAPHLRAISWELPLGWSQLPGTEAPDNDTVWRASGPPVSSLPGSNLFSSAEESSAPDQPASEGIPPWSRLRLADQPAQFRHHSMLRLQVVEAATNVDRGLDAAIRMVIDVDRNRIEPIAFRLQPEWTLLSVTIPSSGRVIETPRVDPKSHLFWMWPDVEDYDGDRLVIHATGRRRIPSNPSQTSIPATWFLRAEHLIGSLQAVAIAPGGSVWTADTGLQGERISITSITPEDRSFLRTVPEDALVFRCREGRTPALAFEPIGVAFNVSTNMEFRIDGDQVLETFTVAADSPSLLPENLTILAGAAGGRPPYRWMLRGSDRTGPLSLSVSDVLVSDEEVEQSFQIRLGDRSARGRRLVGQRAYTLAGPLPIQLPSVSGATRQLASVLVNDNLQATQLGPTVLKVPRSSGILDVTSSDSPARKHVGRTATHLRYDPAARPSILLSRTDIGGDASIIWHQALTLHASASGTDNIDLRIDATLAEPLVIEHDQDLRLISIRRDNVAVSLDNMPTHPLRLPAGTKRETIEIQWHRNQRGSAWARRAAIPDIVTQAVKINSVYQIKPTPDTFAPATLLRFERDAGGVVERIPGRANHSVLMVPQHLALACGWLLALGMFSASWFLARRHPLYLVIPLAFAGTLLFLGWPWQAGIIGWLAIPIISSGLLVTSLDWLSRSAENSHWDSVRIKQGGRGSRDLSTVQRVPMSIGWFLVGLLGSSFAANHCVFGQETASKGSSGLGALDVLLPVDREGNLVGDKVYIPTVLHRELFPPIDRDQAQPARFESAHYRVDLLQLLEGSTRQVPFVEADFLVHVETTTTRLSLPFSAQSIRRVELRSGDQSRIVQFVPQGEESIVVTVPPGNLFRLRLTLIPRATYNVTEGNENASSGTPTSGTTPDSILKLRLTIPAVVASHLTVEGNHEQDRVTINEAYGLIESDRGPRRWDAALGPTGMLSLDYQPASGASMLETKPLDRRYAIQVGKYLTSIDCEVDFRRDYSFGDAVQLVILDSHLPRVSSKHWQIQRGYRVSESRWSVSLEKISDVPSPIRFTWQVPTVWSGANDSSRMTIPEVIPYTTSQVGGAWFAINHDPELDVVPIHSDAIELIDEQVFRDVWTGYHTRVEQAFRTSKTFPKLDVRPILQPTSRVSQNHHLHVATTNLQLRYEAVMRIGNTSSSRQFLRIPSDVVLLSLSVNGEPVTAVPAKFADYTFVSLGEFSSGTEIKVAADCEMRFSPDQRFRRPVLRLQPGEQVTESYVVSRDRSLVVSPISEHPSDDSDQRFSDTFLLGGHVPISQWRIQDLEHVSMDDGYLPGDYQVMPTTATFPCEQFIQLAWNGGTWVMQTSIRFTTSIPDYVDVQIPSRWSDGLSIESSPLWSRQPGLDPSFQVVRIACDPRRMTDNTITIRSLLSDGDQGRVSASTIHVLGGGNRRVFVSVPNRLTREPVQWRTSAMKKQRLPSRFAAWSDPQDDRTTYLATAPAWSLELATNPKADVAASAFAADLQVFPQGDRTLVMGRWDLVPGDLESIALQIPQDGKCIKAWTAGRLVASEPVVGSQSNTKLVRIPLSLSRLPQSVEVLISLPTSRPRNEHRLPELIQIPVGQQWVTEHRSEIPVRVPPDSNTPSPSQVEGLSPQERARGIELATSVVSAIEGALDALADRPTEEIGTWFLPWASRYHHLAASQGRVMDWSVREPLVESDSSTTASLGDDAGGEVAEDETRVHDRRWSQLDAKMLDYAARLMPAGFQPSPVRFGVGDFPGYQRQRTSLLSDHEPLVLAPSMASPAATALRLVMRDTLTILFVGGCLLLLRPLRSRLEPWFEHPATWLLLMGSFAMLIAPQPVAIALILVALTLPLFSQSRGIAGFRSSP